MQRRDGIDFFEAEVVFMDLKKNEINRVKLFSVEPHQIYELGVMSWNEDSRTFSLFNKDKVYKWNALIS